MSNGTTENNEIHLGDCVSSFVTRMVCGSVPPLLEGGNQREQQQGCAEEAGPHIVDAILSIIISVNLSHSISLHKMEEWAWESGEETHGTGVGAHTDPQSRRFDHQ